VCARENSQLILGSYENNLLHLIKNLQDNLRNGDSVRIAVAYISKAGYDLFQPILLKCLHNGVKVELIVGLGQGNTHPLALEHLRNLTEEYPEVILCRVVWGREIARNRFHPKIYIFTNDGNSQIVLGSSNLTGGGLRENIEANAVITDKVLADQAMSFFKYIRKNSVLLDEDIINIYCKYYKKAKKIRKYLVRSREMEEINEIIAKKQKFQVTGENAILYVVWNDRRFSGPPSKGIVRKYKGISYFPHKEPWETDYIFDIYSYVDKDSNCFNRVRPGSLIFICSSENHMKVPMKVIGYLYVKRKRKNHNFRTSDGFFNTDFPYVIEAEEGKSTLFRPYLIFDSKIAKRLSTFKTYSFNKQYSTGLLSGEKMPDSFRIWSAIRAVRGLTDQDALEILSCYLQLPSSRDHNKVQAIIDELKSRL